MLIFKSHQTIDVLARYLPEDPIIIEAGAYIGNDTSRMARKWPQGTIYSFEPVPDIFVRLEENTRAYPNIHIYQKALSSMNGSASLYIAEKPTKPGVPTQASSLHAPKERLSISPMIFPRTITVPTCTLDTWAHERNITRVDLIWLDLQGHELAVLQASPFIVSTASLLLLEVSFVESYQGQPSVEQVVSWAAEAGFECIGRDFVDQSQWFFGNLLFARRN